MITLFLPFEHDNPINNTFRQISFNKCHLATAPCAPCIAQAINSNAVCYFIQCRKHRATVRFVMSSQRDAIWPFGSGLIHSKRVFIVISNLTESDGLYHIFKMTFLYFCVNTYCVAVLYHYFDIVSTGWYFRLVSGSSFVTCQEGTQSQVSERYQVCLQSSSFSMHH